MTPKPGEAYMIDLGLAGKLRPAVILSREDLNKRVCPSQHSSLDSTLRTVSSASIQLANAMFLGKFELSLTPVNATRTVVVHYE